MTLRDRIAEAILKEDQLRVCKLSNADIRYITEAVIAELGLREEMKYPGGTFSFTPPQRRRYVTDWVTDE